eukprot:362592_1
MRTFRIFLLLIVWLYFLNMTYAEDDDTSNSYDAISTTEDSSFENTFDTQVTDNDSSSSSSSSSQDFDSDTSTSEEKSISDHSMSDDNESMSQEQDASIATDPNSDSSDVFTINESECVEHCSCYETQTECEEIIAQGRNCIWDINESICSDKFDMNMNKKQSAAAFGFNDPQQTTNSIVLIVVIAVLIFAGICGLMVYFSCKIDKNENRYNYEIGNEIKACEQIDVVTGGTNTCTNEVVHYGEIDQSADEIEIEIEVSIDEYDNISVVKDVDGFETQQIQNNGETVICAESDNDITLPTNEMIDNDILNDMEDECLEALMDGDCVVQDVYTNTGYVD